MRYVALLIGLLFSGTSYAASTQITITINGPPSTAVTCGSSSAYTLTATVAAGTVICKLAVTPNNWNGAWMLTQTSGPQANAFVIDASGNLDVGTAALTQTGSYALTISATP